MRCLPAPNFNYEREEFTEMPFIRYALPKKPPADTCNGRMRSDDRSDDRVETYCPVPANGRRCNEHDGSNVKKAKQEKAKQAAVRSTTVGELVQAFSWEDDVWYERRDRMSLDRQILTLGCIIDALANQKPLASLTDDDAERLAKLMKIQADLIGARASMLLRFWELEMKAGARCLSGGYVGASDAVKDFAWFEEKMAAYGACSSYGFGKASTGASAAAQGGSNDHPEAAGAQTTQTTQPNQPE